MDRELLEYLLWLTSHDASYIHTSCTGSWVTYREVQPNPNQGVTEWQIRLG